MLSGIKATGKWGGARANSGGRRDGAGRPTTPENDRLTHQINLRVTVGQWAEYLRRGGAKWLRADLSKGVVKEQKIK